MEIEQDFSKETVTWPTPQALCYPVFKDTSNKDTSIAKPPIISKSHSKFEVHNPNSDISSCGLLYSVDVETMDEKEILNNLPKDKDSLLELRSKLGMELVWLRQAISSRQKACLIQ